MPAPMKKITYWIADCLNDSKAYSIRKKTRREVVAALKVVFRASDYGKPRKVVVEYVDTFDLIQMALGEGGLDEGRW